MDNIDSTIIKSLKENSRTPFLQIAKELKVSEGTIRRRVKELVKEKEILKFTINTKKDSFAIVGISIDTQSDADAIIGKLKNLQAHDIYDVTGRFDIIAFVPAKEREKVNDILEKIRHLKGVRETETFTILRKN